MKNLLLLATLFSLFSCKKEETISANEVVADIKQNTEISAKEGTGKITLRCNGKEITTEGVCGGLTIMGALIIAVKDKTNPAKVFTINFNVADFPVDGKEYLIKSKDYSVDKNPENEVSVSFMEALSNNKMNVWETQPTSGKLAFSVKGNEIKCQLKDLKLKPSIVYNADDLQGEGTISGELTLYKN
ncbi:MAG: hypothetical protein ABI549_06125 [Flavobacterium sp.]|uniref:hypothetical protein n=1 Tax=Flavobacterium sp. TaxID=239 RepID=UPI003264AC23